MSTKRKQASPLIEAAQAFDDALDTHARVAELFVRTPLTTTKQIERVNELLGEVAAAEEQLRERGAALSDAITVARDRQVQLGEQIIARLPEVKERNEQLLALLQAYQALGTEAGALNTTAATTPPRELRAALALLSDRALALSADARTAGFDELATQAHALHQRLAASVKKLQSATLE